MALEVKINNRIAKVELLNRDGQRCKIKVDETIYDIDITMVEDDVYSLLLEGKSYNIELIPGETHKKYIVNTAWQSYDAEVIDAESKYLISRGAGGFDDGVNTIISPMPGKIVAVPVKIGEEVEAGQTVIIVSAMKMESEFKAKADGTVKEIYVQVGDTVDGNQVLVVIE